VTLAQSGADASVSKAVGAWLGMHVVVRLQELRDRQRLEVDEGFCVAYRLVWPHLGACVAYCLLGARAVCVEAFVCGARLEEASTVR
jgi:hypothetical protein